MKLLTHPAPQRVKIAQIAILDKDERAAVIARYNRHATGVLQRGRPAGEVARAGILEAATALPLDSSLGAPLAASPVALHLRPGAYTAARDGASCAVGPAASAPRGEALSASRGASEGEGGSGFMVCVRAFAASLNAGESPEPSVATSDLEPWQLDIMKRTQRVHELLRHLFAIVQGARGRGLTPSMAEKLERIEKRMQSLLDDSRADVRARAEAQGQPGSTRDDGNATAIVMLKAIERQLHKGFVCAEAARGRPLGGSGFVPVDNCV